MLSNVQPTVNQTCSDMFNETCNRICNTQSDSQESVQPNKKPNELHKTHPCIHSRKPYNLRSDIHFTYTFDTHMHWLASMYIFKRNVTHIVGARSPDWGPHMLSPELRAARIAQQAVRIARRKELRKTKLNVTLADVLMSPLPCGPLRNETHKFTAELLCVKRDDALWISFLNTPIGCSSVNCHWLHTKKRPELNDQLDMLAKLGRFHPHRVYHIMRYCLSGPKHITTQLSCYQPTCAPVSLTSSTAKIIITIDVISNCFTWHKHK